MTESIGERIYSIRRALGPDARTELSLRAFAAMLTESSGKTYYDSELSKMERGVRGVSIEDVANIAALDPLMRGREWLAWGVAPQVPAYRVAEAILMIDADGNPTANAPAELRRVAEPEPSKKRKAK